VKSEFNHYLQELITTIATNHAECPILQKCASTSGINCGDRNFAECHYFMKQIQENMILLRRRRHSHYLFEWRPFKGPNWYTINESNVNPKRHTREFYEVYRNLMNRVLQGETVPILGTYDRENKTLTVSGGA